MCEPRASLSTPPETSYIPPVSATSDTTLLSARALARLGRDLHRRGWLPATSGNLSARLPSGDVLITASGLHKGRLRPEDMVEVDPEGTPRAEGQRPSAETALHLQRYREGPSTGAVVHVHSPNATLISLRATGELRFRGYELLKAFPGVRTHDVELVVPIFPNDQDMRRLANVIERRRRHDPFYGYLIVGHGLYAWGDTLDDALRHLEAFDFLFHCKLMGGP